MKLWQEFKAFAFKGNMIDLAVAVVIGTAFGAVINSLVKDVIMPSVALALPGDMPYTGWTIGSGEKPVPIGKFVGEVVNFLIVATAVFLVIVKVLGSIVKLTTRPAPAAAPVLKECPMCISSISIKAKRCPHCTSMLEGS